MSPAKLAMWAALLPTYGSHAWGMATTAVLKVPRGAERTVERSVIKFFDDRGGVIAEIADAFALRAGTRLAGPLSEMPRDERRRPPEARVMSWTLDEWQTPAVPMVDARPGAGELTLWCSPLHVPVRDDRQLFVQYLNVGADEVHLPHAIRNATLWVDGAGYPSLTGVHWDGRSDVPVGGWAGPSFRMSDFDGAPLLGAHEVAIGLLGLRTVTQSVHLVGEPWQPRT